MQNLSTKRPFSKAAVKMAFVAAFISAGGIACNNYDLVAKFENPGSAETFTSKFYMFVSSWTTMGDMSGQPYSQCASLTGVAKADCACTKAAAANSLRKHANHDFKAYLGLTPSYHPPCRAVGYPTGCATNITGPWYNTQDNPVMAIYTSSAFATSISNPIKFTEQRTDAGSGPVWTGASTSGAYTNSCPGDWSIADTNTANVGDLTQQTVSWQSLTTLQCNTPARVYCFATSPP